MQHPFAIVTLTKFQRRNREQGAHVPAEALRRRVLEMVGHVCDREPRVFKHACSMCEAGHGEISFRCRKMRSKKTAHQSTRYHAQFRSERTYGARTQSGLKDCFEKSPTVIRRTRKVKRELCQGNLFNITSAIMH